MNSTKKDDAELNKIARQIFAKMKGWDAKAMREDRRDFPEYHAGELEWLLKRLRKIAKGKTT